MRFEGSAARIGCSQDRFTFSSEDLPSTTFVFSSFSSTPSTQTRRRPRKRSRARADVDGEGSGNLQKKKRRLRLDLITSRLSKPYAFPTTNIVTRGASKIAIWARQRALGRNSLRKAAIMNWIRLKRDTTREMIQKPLEHNRQVHTRQQTSKPPNVNRKYVPLCPSPLGLTNYDALDQEGDPFDDDDEVDDIDDRSVNSDWNVRILEPTESVLDDYDSLNPAEDEIIGRHPSIPSTKEIVDLVTRSEKHQETSFSQYGP